MLSDLFDIVMMLFYLLKRIMTAKINSPKTLFKLSVSSSDLPGDNVYHSWANVLIDKRGRLYVEENSIMYSAHSLTHSSGRTTVHKAVSFEELPALIAESCDPAAAKYSGMNRKNWRKYIKEPKAVKIASKYPIVAFGRYQWYVLEQKNGIMILLSRYGIDTRPWNTEEKLVDWKESTLCHWLNTDFIKSHFTRKEKRTFVPFDDGTLVSLPDSDMVEKYLENDGALMVQPNKYALKRGAFVYPFRSDRPDYSIYFGNGLAWLKDTYKGEKENLRTSARCIYWDGDICLFPFDYDKVTVRPLIQVSQQKLKKIRSHLYPKGSFFL